MKFLLGSQERKERKLSWLFHHFITRLCKIQPFTLRLCKKDERRWGCSCQTSSVYLETVSQCNYEPANRDLLSQNEKLVPEQYWEQRRSHQITAHTEQPDTGVLYDTVIPPKLTDLSHHKQRKQQQVVILHPCAWTTRTCKPFGI